MPGPPDPPVDLVSQNVDAVAELHQRAERELTRYQRAIEGTTAWLGRPLFFYLTLVSVGVWIGANLLLIHQGRAPFDAPPFAWLQGIIGLAALLLTVVVLITQNRQGRLAEQRAHLDLQVNLLAEQKIAKLIALVEELRRDLPNVQDRHDPEALAMTEAADAHAVLDVLEERLEAAREECIDTP